MTVEKLINDGLMGIFFFAVGLEIKREIVCGRLSSAKRPSSVLAAAGGMLFPAIIFTAFNHGTMAANGRVRPPPTSPSPSASSRCSATGSPCRSDVLTALAIADDLEPFWSSRSSTAGRCRSDVCWRRWSSCSASLLHEEMGEKRMFFYLVPAVVVWGLFYYSGVHSTISGVAMAMLIPMTPVTARSISCTRCAI